VGQKPGGGVKNQKGSHFKSTVLDVCSNQGAKREMGRTDFKWGAGTTGPPAGDGPGPDTDVVRYQTLAISHKYHFDVTGHF